VDGPELKRFLSTLGAAYAGSDADIREVLYVSFLENLSPGSPIFDVFGPHLREDFID